MNTIIQMIKFNSNMSISILLLLNTFVNNYFLFLAYLIYCIHTNFTIIKLDTILYMVINIIYGLEFTLNFLFLKTIIKSINLLYFFIKKHRTNYWYTNLKYYIDKIIYFFIKDTASIEKKNDDIVVENNEIQTNNILSEDNLTNNILSEDNLTNNILSDNINLDDEDEYDPELDEDFEKIHNNLTFTDLEDLSEDERKKKILEKFSQSMKLFGDLCNKIVEKNK